MMIKLTVAAIGLIVAPAAAAQPTSHAQHHNQPEASAMFKTPQSIAHEHGEIHEALAKAAGEAGELGAAARNLEAVLAPHFRREEQIATPPLALLPELATGKATAEMRQVLPMTDALEAELPHMMREHAVIRKANAALRAAATKAGRGEYVRFTDALAVHARQEEEILYPAAILVGRYVKATAPK